MSDAEIRTGPCACDAIVFPATCANTILAAHCHCLGCRKATGSVFATVVGIRSGT